MKYTWTKNAKPLIQGLGQGWELVRFIPFEKIVTWKFLYNPVSGGCFAVDRHLVVYSINGPDECEYKKKYINNKQRVMNIGSSDRFDKHSLQTKHVMLFT